MTDVIAVVMVFSIPIIAILTNFYLKLQRLKLENNNTDKKQDQDLEHLKKQISYLMAEQNELRERLTQLEDKAQIRIPESELKQEKIDRRNRI